jgi:hypothetical protein
MPRNLAVFGIRSGVLGIEKGRVVENSILWVTLFFLSSEQTWAVVDEESYAFSGAIPFLFSVSCMAVAESMLLSKTGFLRDSCTDPAPGYS